MRVSNEGLNKMKILKKRAEQSKLPYQEVYHPLVHQTGTYSLLCRQITGIPEDRHRQVKNLRAAVLLGWLFPT